MRKVVTVVLMVALTALTVLNLTYRTGPEPDEVYEMCNRNIRWYYAGK